MHDLCFLVVFPVALLSVLLFDNLYSKLSYACTETQQLFVLHFYFVKYQVEEMLWIIVGLLVHYLYDLIL